MSEENDSLVKIETKIKGLLESEYSKVFVRALIAERQVESFEKIFEGIDRTARKQALEIIEEFALNLPLNEEDFYNYKQTFKEKYGLLHYD